MAENPESQIKVAILGGGIASLVTAYELTGTEELRRRHDVTVYQMGWRLGGKLASGANTEKNNRNEEHGLHVWFGFYDNAFSRIKTCYEALQTIQPDHRYPNYLDAFKPNDFTPIGYRSGADAYGFWKFKWPANSGTPGTCVDLPDPILLLKGLVDFFWNLLRDIIGDSANPALSAETLIARHLPHFRAFAEGRSEQGEPTGGVEPDSLHHAVQLLGKWLEVAAEKTDPLIDEDAGRLANYAHDLRDLVKDGIKLLNLDHPDQHPILSGLEINLTIVKGCFRRRYGIYRDFNLNRIDAWDLRAWLIENGCDKTIANQSSLLRGLYDIPFAYENGDLSRPNFAAGASLRWVIRTFLTYQGHALYLPQAGFGEAVIAPYYEVLKSRGVKFEFFHKLSNMTLSGDDAEIAQLTFEVQAKTVSGTQYDPVWFEDGLYRWPTEPLWDQLQDGETLRQKGVNFESHWCDQPAADERILQNGVDFDLVVLGIAGTAMKRRNQEDSLFCENLRQASQTFRDWTDQLGTVATAGVQLWSPRTSQELGWESGPATVGGPEPLDVWADMSPVLDTEKWSGVADPPKSLHYLCGPVSTTLFDQPETDTGVPEQARQIVRQYTLDWLQKNGIYDWPTAVTPSGGFDWEMLYDPSGTQGSARLDAQFVRINIDPTECCGNSFADTTRFRPNPGEKLLTNLYLVGADTNTGINVTCVEGATISAMKASRAICGSPEIIFHEDFLGGGFPDLPTENPKLT